LHFNPVSLYRDIRSNEAGTVAINITDGGLLHSHWFCIEGFNCSSCFLLLRIYLWLFESDLLMLQENTNSLLLLTE
jgi:hypothetical protein